MEDAPDVLLESPQGTEMLFDPERNQWVRVQVVTGGLLMYDPDAPFPERPLRSPILHWMALFRQSFPEVKYMGPHPPPTSNPHQYVVLKLEVPPGLRDLRFLRFYENRRSNFPLMKLLPELGLKVIASAKFFSSERKPNEQKQGK